MSPAAARSAVQRCETQRMKREGAECGAGNPKGQACSTSERGTANARPQTAPQPPCHPRGACTNSITDSLLRTSEHDTAVIC